MSRLVLLLPPLFLPAVELSVRPQMLYHRNRKASRAHAHRQTDTDRHTHLIGVELSGRSQVLAVFSDDVEVVARYVDCAACERERVRA